MTDPSPSARGRIPLPIKTIEKSESDQTVRTIRTDQNIAKDSTDASFAVISRIWRY